MTNKTKELVAAGHALAKELHCAESAALVRELATQLDVQRARADVLADADKQNTELKDENEYIRNRFKELDRMFGKNLLPRRAKGKLQQHLINFAIAVTAHGNNPLRNAIEPLGNLRGRIAIG